MSTPRLLEELLDHVVDHLHDERANLENCCLVSKSWIPRARKHLFSTISIRGAGNLQSWKNAFPDPSSSPARYTKTLVIGCPEVVAIEDVVAGGWLSAFSRVVRLAMHVPSVGDGLDQQDISLIPFHGLFPAIRSLSIHLITFPSSPIFNLICSFPTLENLHVEVCKRLTDRVDGFDVQQSPVQTLNPPAFSGSLKLQVKGGWNPLIHPLLSLPSGIHFRSLCLALNDEKDVSSAVTLVERCHSTLESLRLSCGYIRMFALFISIPVTYLFQWKGHFQAPSTSQGRRISSTSRFLWARIPGGSSRHSERSHPTTKISSKSHSTYPSFLSTETPVAWTLLVSRMPSEGLHGVVGGGQSSISSSPSSGTHMRSVRRSRTPCPRG